MGELLEVLKGVLRNGIERVEIDYKSLPRRERLKEGKTKIAENIYIERLKGDWSETIEVVFFDDKRQKVVIAFVNSSIIIKKHS